MKAASGLAIFAPTGSALEGWARSAVDSGGTLIDDLESIGRVPAGTAWLCSVDQAAQLRSLRPTDPVLVVRDPEPAWSQLAHDVRGPIGVISGALSELESSDPMLELAVRATRQLTSLARCWEACGLSPTFAPTKTLAVLERTQRTFRELEPRRAQAIQIEGADSTLETDANRLELGLLCMLAYLSRVHRGPIVVRPRADGIELEGLPKKLIPSGPPFPSRVDLAMRLLAPITDRWEDEETVTRWVARAAPTRRSEPGT